MKQRDHKFRAMFKDMDSGNNAWITIGVNERYDQPGWSQVSPWVEFTGLLDKNGKEIYEGDVVRVTHGGNYSTEYEVQWSNEGTASFFLIHARRESDKYGIFTRKIGLRGDKPEVLGNIYENPELLTP